MIHSKRISRASNSSARAQLCFWLFFEAFEYLMPAMMIIICYPGPCQTPKMSRSSCAARDQTAKKQVRISKHVVARAKGEWVQ